MNGRKTTVYKQSGRGKLREFCPDLLTHGYKASPAPSLMSVHFSSSIHPRPTHTHKFVARKIANDNLVWTQPIPSP